MTRKRLIILTLSLLVVLVGSARPAHASGGIASKYPGDSGIDKDPEVLLAEGFEETSLETLFARWTNVSNKDERVMEFSADVPETSSGRQSLRMTATRGRDTGGHLWKLLERGVDKMHARFYVKFAPDHPYVHHLVTIGAQRDSPPWPKGGAGRRPDGADNFHTGIELDSGWGRNTPPGQWFFYTYWHEMRSWQGEDGTVFYGNAFAPAKPQAAPRGEWQCVEFMMKANSTPGAHDGEQAFWINGVLAGRWAPGTPTGKWKNDVFVAGDGLPFEGFRWRTTDDLKINTFWLLYYMAAVFKGKNQMTPKLEVEPYRRDVTRVWFDHIVLATDYIGPIAPEPEDQSSPAAPADVLNLKTQRD